MSPSAIVLNVCVAVFLALFTIFTLYLIAQARKLRPRKVVSQEAKEVPLFTEPKVQPVLAERKASFQLAEAVE